MRPKMHDADGRVHALVDPEDGGHAQLAGGQLHQLAQLTRPPAPPLLHPYMPVFTSCRADSV